MSLPAPPLHILFQVTADDINYLPFLKSLITHGKVTINASKPDTLIEVILRAKEIGATAIVTTSNTILQMLVPDKFINTDGARSTPTIDNYAGSILDYKGFEFLIIDPLHQLVSVSHGSFITKRYLSKLFDKAKWLAIPEFKWELFHPKNTEEILSYALESNFAAVDIETAFDEYRRITCISFSFVRFHNHDKSYSIRTVCFDLADIYTYQVIKLICEMEGLYKVFQNGKYDNLYLLRYGIATWGWSGDTLNLFHGWYSELPKDLAFLATFALRKWSYWKHEAANDGLDYFAYNAKDAFATACIWLSLVQEAPAYAVDNFIQTFRLNPACLLCEGTGIARDAEVMEEELSRFTLSLEVRLSKLRTMVSSPEFNPSSPQQVLKLFNILGSGDVTDTTPPSMDRVRNRHPLNDRILTEIIAYRKDRKLVTSYLRDEYKDKKRGVTRTKSWNNRIYYSIQPTGTDTGRCSSQESAFWCGWQLQNIPRDRKDIQIKRGLVSDPGFYLGEVDRSQAEARDVAYLSGDKNLIAAVDDESRDFHGHNASAFFGIPYENIVASSYSEEKSRWIHKKIDEVLRDLAKRTNHGANYNMMAGMLLQTMGIKNVMVAQSALLLPMNWSLKQVCQYLLNKFDETYPVLRGAYYDKLIGDVTGSHLLVGPTGWTRFCFGKPNRDKGKRDLNRYAAHPSQSLNAMELNNSFLRVFYEVALPNPDDFRLLMQIHDSLFFQYRIGRTDLAYQVADCMRNPIPVKDIFGITRILDIPVDIKGEGHRWSELKAMIK